MPWAHAQDHARLEGVWSSTLTTPEDPRWRIEDHLCGMCTPSEYEHLQRLLADPANRDRGLRELQQEARTTSRLEIDQLVTAAARERFASITQPADGSATCDPPSLLVAASGGPLPVSIELRDDHVILHNQHWNVVRTVRLSNAAPIATGEPSLYGNATARLEGSTLIVESVNLLPIATTEAVTTAKARVVERYTANEDGSRLDLEVAIDDPDTYREPRIWYRPRMRTSDVQIVEDDPCANLEE
ncbi:MAG: hypothetical protein EHM50_01560 [Lysobacterales bacterium]|nr:MAG: hypothetical protein EHM50_01560 [Xanthomonadales bacterium]